MRVLIILGLEALSALTLFVLGVFANNHNFALALDDLALLAHGLHGRSDFHFYTSKSVVSPKRDAHGRMRGRASRSLASPVDSAPGDVVGRHLDRDLVAGQDADEIHAQLSGNVRQDLVAVLKFDLKHGVRIGFNDCAFHFNYIAFGQVFTPSGLTAESVTDRRTNLRIKQRLPVLQFFCCTFVFRI